MTLSELTQTVVDHCQQQVEDRHVLAINDTTEINLQAHAGRLKPESIGVVGNNKDLGFFLHPTMILDAETGFPLGLSAIQLWTREPGHLTKKSGTIKHSRLKKKNRTSGLPRLNVPSLVFCPVA